jgi:ABC-type spermidine/putrescine transport system permease subunit II
MLKLGITPKINALGALMVLLNVLVVVVVMGRHLKLILKK